MDIELIESGDNYVYLLRDAQSGDVAVVDPGEALPVEQILAARSWSLTHILNTHHHTDHVGGNERLKSLFNAKVIGSAADPTRIPGFDVGVRQGDTVSFGNTKAQVIETPGHTWSHIVFWFADINALFCGDTIFSLGCGHVFEGTMADMWGSLLKLRALPKQTSIYCGHEYTQANARFALTVDPDNTALKVRAEEVDSLRKSGQPTIPITLDKEQQTNPFLRADHPELKAALDMADAEPVEVFTTLRRRKDSYGKSRAG